jgi:HK97 family phage major capsid protein
MRRGGHYQRAGNGSLAVIKAQERGKMLKPGAEEAITAIITRAIQNEALINRLDQRLSPREALEKRDGLSPEQMQMKTAGAWLRKAANESLNGAGAAIVPNETAAFIESYRDRAVFRSNASVYNTASDSLTIPRRTGGVSVNFVGEGAVIPSSQPSFDGIGLTAQKIAAFGTFSTELEEDAAADITAFFLQDAGSAMGLKEDDCAFNGDGTSTYGGIYGIIPALNDSNHTAGRIAAGSGHKSFNLLDATDLSNLLGLLPDKFWPNAKLYLSGYGASQYLARLSASSGAFQVSGAGPNRTMTYLGIPVITTPKMVGSGDQSGKIMVLFGDLSSAAALGSARPMTFAVSTHRFLEFDSLAWRMTERFSSVIHNLGDNSAPGAVVALQGTA